MDGACLEIKIKIGTPKYFDSFACDIRIALRLILKSKSYHHKDTENKQNKNYLKGFEKIDKKIGVLKQQKKPPKTRLYSDTNSPFITRTDIQTVTKTIRLNRYNFSIEY